MFPSTRLARYLAAAALAGPMLMSGRPAFPQGIPAHESLVVEAGRHAVDRYEATIRRTAFGVAHIEAGNLANLGFGEGYAQAEDHLCTIADQVVRARGERAKYFGRGENDAHLNSDIAVRAVRIHEGAVELLAAEPPEIQRWVEGFAAGYNQYLAETGADAVPGWCRGEPWVRPISAADIPAIQRLNFGILNVPELFAGVSPPTEATTSGAASASDPAGPAAGLAFDLPVSPPGASNGWALGHEMTESGRGMLLAQPHYAWIGSNRFWEKHLRIPGELDVYGMHLIGHPGVIIGFNEHVAWTHTVPAGSQYTLYAVDLVPGQPTRYRYGDEERDMASREIAIEVRGEPEPVRRTLWSTHHGPLVASGSVQWTAGRAYAWRDANADNGALLRHVLATGRAGSMEAFQNAHGEHQGLPWLNTIAASADGVAWYADGSVRPHVGLAALADWHQRRETDPLTGQLWQVGTVLLDGSDPAADWVDDPDARHPGVVPFREAPQLERTDYVFNANDSYWLVHADTLLEAGISPLYGRARSALSLRSRSNVLHLTNATPDRPAGEDGRFNLREVQEAALGNRSLTGDLLVPDLVARCRATPSVSLDGEAVDLTEACDVLAGWDRRFDLDSRGAVLFREWIGRYEPQELRRAGALFAVDFDPGDPVRTPHTLEPGPLALENLAKAVGLLEARDIPLDTPLGELQYAPSKLPSRMPVHGGENWEGVLNLMLGRTGATTLEPIELAPPVEGSRFLTEAGYPVLHGTSFLMVLEFTDDGPRAEAILTYGQSGDPESEHFTDQTELFSRKEWRPILFRPEDVAAGTLREYTAVGSVAGGLDVQDPAIAPFEELDDGWNELTPGGHTACAHGDPFAFYVRRGDPARVLLYLTGGGGCSSAEDCVEGSNRYTQRAQPLPYGAFRGILDPSHPENPFREHTMVVVPVCTGDVHLGERDEVYVLEGEGGVRREFTVRHRGMVNGMAALDWMAANLPEPAEVFVAGGSAGAVATPVYASLLAQRHPEARVAGLSDDAGSYIAGTMPLTDTRRWGMADALAAHAGWADFPEGLATDRLLVTAAQGLPNLRLYQLDHAHDRVQVFFQEVGGNPEPDLPALLRRAQDRIRSQVPTYRAFVLGGYVHQSLHFPTFYVLAQDGYRLRDWVAAIAAGEEVPDVVCSGCEMPEFILEEADRRGLEGALGLLSSGTWEPDSSRGCPSEEGRFSLGCAVWTELTRAFDDPLAAGAWVATAYAAAARVPYDRNSWNPILKFNDEVATSVEDVRALLQEVQARAP